MTSQELSHQEQFPATAVLAAHDSASPAARPPDPTTIAWSPRQLQRIADEWRDLQRGYAFHPAVRIVPLHGDPPDEFQVHYRVRTVAVGSTGALEYHTTCSVHVRLAAGFPGEAPLVRPHEAIFHPNVTNDRMQILPGWDADSTLASLVERIGLMLAYQTYDPWNVWNPVAFEWLNANTTYLPSDPNANFRTDAGGKPLKRLIQHAPQAISQLREQLENFTHWMLEAKSAPPISEVERIIPRLRANCAMFQGDDLPEPIRRQATDLSQWAMQLRQHVGFIGQLAQRKSAAGGAVSVTRELRSLMEALQKELAHLRGLATPPQSPQAAIQWPRQPHLALPHLPQVLSLQQSDEKLRLILSSSRHQKASGLARLEALSHPLPALPPLSGPLHGALQAEIDAQHRITDPIVSQLKDALAAAEPLLRGATLEVVALERVILWRRAAGAAAPGTDAAEQTQALGSDGLQAYFARSDAGEYGPFQFEQRLDLGSASIAVRDVHRLEVWDLKAGFRLAKAEAAEVTAPIPDPDSGQSYPMTFRMTPRCGVLAEQLARAIHHTSHYLTELSKAGIQPVATSAAGAESPWHCQLADALTSPSGLAAIAAAQKQRSDLWSRLYYELQALGAFKQRLGTYYLITRAREDVPRFKTLLADARQTLDSSNEQIQHILARCGRDIETDRPIMPAKYADQYAKQIRARDTAKADIKRYELLLHTFARHLATRLQDDDLRGSAAPLRLSAIAALPPSLEELAPAMTDASIEGAVSELDQLLAVELWPNRSVAPAGGEAPATAESSAAAIPEPTLPESEPPPLPLDQQPTAVEEIIPEESTTAEESHFSEGTDEEFVDWPSDENDSGNAG